MQLILCGPSYQSWFPDLLADFLGVLGVVRDENVVEDGSGLHLPQVESDAADFLPVVQFRVGLVVRVVNLGVNPGSLQT